MNPGQQLMIVKINNGYIVQHPPTESEIEAGASPQQNKAQYCGSMFEVNSYIGEILND